jgi:hypothetical protein
MGDFADSRKDCVRPGFAVLCAPRQSARKDEGAATAAVDAASLAPLTATPSSASPLLAESSRTLGVRSPSMIVSAGVVSDSSRVPTVSAARRGGARPITG